MVDQLRDLLNDSTDTQVTIAMKKLYLNRGIARLWPKVHKIATATIDLNADDYIYDVPAAVGDGMIVAVEFHDSDDDQDFQRFSDYDYIPAGHSATGRIRINRDIAEATAELRIMYAAPIDYISGSTYAAMQSETWTGPDRALALPVYYAAALCAMRKIDDRQDTNRYSTTQGQNGVTDRDMLALAQTWMGQFELEVGEMERPLFPAVD